MKIFISFYLTFFCLLLGYSQADYPQPEKTTNRLFFIQHSKSHNTYVYDAKTKGGNIDSSKPIDQYRILYAKNGQKKPLTSIQKDLAYGMILLESKANSFKYHLAATKKVIFYLNYDENNGPRINVTINNKKMYLDRIFIHLNSSGLSAKAEYVMFYGKDFNTGKTVTEKYIVK